MRHTRWQPYCTDPSVRGEPQGRDRTSYQEFRKSEKIDENLTHFLWPLATTPAACCQRPAETSALGSRGLLICLSCHWPVTADLRFMLTSAILLDSRGIPSTLCHHLLSSLRGGRQGAKRGTYIKAHTPWHSCRTLTVPGHGTAAPSPRVFRKESVTDASLFSSVGISQCLTRY